MKKKQNSQQPTREYGGEVEQESTTLSYTVSGRESVVPISLPIVICNKCKHEWIPRRINEQTGLPYECPQCKSPRHMQWKGEKEKKRKI